MIRNIEFEKDPDGRWYAILPEWEGEREELEMVSGADILIDILANGWNGVSVRFSDVYFEGSHTLTHQNGEYPGWYDNDAWHGPSTIWLCSVTEFVFGRYPEKIYFS